jgi:hypothetical protein
MWVLCAVCGKEGLEEMGKGERLTKDLEGELKEGKNMYVLCV